MRLGKVVGNVVSTKKNDNLTGFKLMVVELLQTGKNSGCIVAVDNVGAGEEEIVLLSFGSSARIAVGREGAPVDAAIVGIVDNPTTIMWSRK